MTTFIALLRAVNVGGTGKLPMSDLKALCEKLGWQNVRTYIASGNVVFKTEKTEEQIKTSLEDALQKYAGKRVAVLIRTAAEMAQVLAKNPFVNHAANRTMVIFLDEPPPSGALNDVAGRKDEEIKLGKREIYVYYGDGIGRSKLKIPAARTGTARNINTIAKLIALTT